MLLDTQKIKVLAGKFKSYAQRPLNFRGDKNIRNYLVCMFHLRNEALKSYRILRTFKYPTTIEREPEGEAHSFLICHSLNVPAWELNASL